MAEDDNISKDFHIDEDGEMNHYRKDAKSVVQFKIVYVRKDVTAKTGWFKPKMAHQIFGERESIFGYRSVAIRLYYLHNSARCCVDVQTSTDMKSDVYKPDDIMASLKPWLPNGFTTKTTRFMEMVDNEKHDMMFGVVLDEFENKQVKLIENKSVNIVYKITKCDSDNQDFQEFHRRFETFLIWYIDGATFIDLNDKRWEIYYVYEEFEHPVSKTTYCSPVGFCTVYKFFSYPDKIRARISQFLILPSHQRQGIGKQLLTVVVEDLKKMKDVVDVTVEEPTPIFQKLRDSYDCITIYTELAVNGLNINSANPNKIEQIMKSHKICKKQRQRVLDILGCFEANKAGTLAYKKHLAKLKKRISGEIERQMGGSKIMCGLERSGIFHQTVDVNNLVEVEYKKYIDDIEPSIEHLQQNVDF